MMAVTDIHDTSFNASTTIAVPSMPLPPGPEGPPVPAVAKRSAVAPPVSDTSSNPVLDARSDSELVLAARSGGQDAFEALFNRWFERAWNVARMVVGNDETASEVAQDSILKAWQRLDDLNEPERFGSWLLSITRNRGLDRIRREKRSPVVGDAVVTELRDLQSQSGRHDWMASGHRSVSDEVSSHHHKELLWAASSALGAKDAALLDLHLRHGLSAEELASTVGGTINSVHQRLFRLRRRLGDAIGAYVLWRGGTPLCPELDDILPANEANVRYFDRAVAKLVSAHTEQCHRCGADRASILDPAALFASVPLLAVPDHLRELAAHGLAARGVPVDSIPAELDFSQMADFDGGAALTRVIDVPKPPAIRDIEGAPRRLLEGDNASLVGTSADGTVVDGTVVDLTADPTADRPEWNPGPILSEAELAGPVTNPNLIASNSGAVASEDRFWRLRALSPAAMVGVGVGVALTVMAVVIAARSDSTTTDTADGDFGVGLIAGEESARARTATSGGRGLAESVSAATGGALETSSVVDQSSNEDSSVSTSYGAAVPLDDGGDKLVARSAAGAALLTTDEDTGNTTVRELQEILAEDVDLVSDDRVDDDAVGGNRETAGSVTATTTGTVATPVDEAGQVAQEEDLAGGSAAAPPATTTPTTVPTTESGAVETDRDDSADDRDDVDEIVEVDDDDDDVGEISLPETINRRPSTTTPATEARPTDPPTTTPSTSPSTTTPPTAAPTTTPTTAPVTDVEVDDDDDVEEVEVDDDDVEEVEVDDDDDDVEEVEAGDTGSVVDGGSSSSNAGGTPSETRPDRAENPSDTRPVNNDRRGGS